MLNALHYELIERGAHSKRCFIPCFGMGTKFRDHWVIKHRNFRTLRNTGIIANDSPILLALFWRLIGTQASDRRKEVAEGIFGVDTAFNRPAFKRYILLLDSQRFAKGRADHLFDQINTSYQFRHWVLYLQAGIHFEKIEISISINDEFNSARAFIINSFCKRD